MPVAVLLLSVVLPADGEDRSYPGAHRDGFGRFLQALRDGLPLYDDHVQPIDAEKALMTMVQSPTPIDRLWGETSDMGWKEETWQLRHGVVRTLIMSCVAGGMLSFLVMVAGHLQWRKKISLVLDCGCGYRHEDDYRNDCPGLLLCVFFTVVLIGVCTAALGTISCSNSYIQFPRVLALAEDMIGNSLNFNTNLRSFLLNFVGSGDTDNEQFGLIGNRSLALKIMFEAGMADISRQRVSLMQDLQTLQSQFQDYYKDQWELFPTTDQFQARKFGEPRGGPKTIETLMLVLDRVPKFIMTFPNVGDQVYVLARRKMNVAYENSHQIIEDLSAQRIDMVRMSRETLLPSHRAMTVATQIFFGLAVFVFLLLAANAVLLDEKAWIACYCLVICTCLCSWCLMGPLYPTAVVIDSVCKNLNQTAGYVGAPLVHSILTRNRTTDVAWITQRNDYMQPFSVRLSDGCLDTSHVSSANTDMGTMFYVLGLEREIINSVFHSYRLDTQFDKDKVLTLSYKDYSAAAKPILQEISEIRGLKDMLLSSDGQAACPGFATGKCLEKAETCDRITYSDEKAEFSFNCSRPACQNDCDDCALACKCCYMLGKLQSIQSGASQLTPTFVTFENTVKELQRNLSAELDLTRVNSFHSLLRDTQNLLEGLDRSCTSAQGLSTLYHEFRSELCDKLLVDEDMQWFCVGVLAVIFTPWLPLLILMLHVKYGDKYADSDTKKSDTETNETNVRATMYHQNFLSTGGELLSSPPIAGPAAAQAITRTMPHMEPHSVVPAFVHGLQEVDDPVSTPYMQIWQDDDVEAAALMNKDFSPLTRNWLQETGAGQAVPASQTQLPPPTHTPPAARGSMAGKLVPLELDMSGSKRSAPVVAQRKATIERRSAAVSLSSVALGGDI